MLSILSIMMFVTPAFFSLGIHNYLNHGKMLLKKEATYLCVYLVLINLCTFLVSCIRGVKELNFEDMTVSYRLKYLALGCLFALAMPFAVNYLMSKVKNSNMPIQFVEKIHWYIIANALLLFVACRGI